jgi:hypothetical protein
MSDSPTLYTRLGGYDAISAVADNLIPRLMEDELLVTSPQSLYHVLC